MVMASKEITEVEIETVRYGKEGQYQADEPKSHDDA